MAHDHLSKSTDRMMQNLFSFATLFLDTCQNPVSTHAPQFRSKNVLFTLKLNLCHNYAAERSFHLLQLRFPCGWRVKISPLPSTLHLLVRTTGICRFTFRLFTPHVPRLDPRVKAMLGHATDSPSLPWAMNHPIGTVFSSSAKTFFAFFFFQPKKP